MSAITVENNRFFLEDMFGKKHELLDCKQLLSNKSSIPMHSLIESERTIPKFLIQLFHIHRDQWKKKEAIEYFVFDIIITSFLIRQSRPLHVLEIGGDNGILSYHLASLLGGFHKKSSLYSVCHVIGNSSNNNWLDSISLVQEPPELSLLVADYDNTCLLSHSFDIVVINGSINFSNPYKVLKEAKRLVKDGGTILLFLQQMPLLEDTFKLDFSERKEYYLNPGVGVMVKENWNEEKKDKEKEKSFDYFLNLRKEAEKMLESTVQPEQIRGLIKRMDREIEQAIVEYNIEQKLELIQVKERLLNHIVNINKQIRKTIQK